MQLALQENIPDNPEKFLCKKLEIDRVLEALERSFTGVMCGLTQSGQCAEESRPLEIVPDEFKNFFILEKRSH